MNDQPKSKAQMLQIGADVDNQIQAIIAELFIELIDELLDVGFMLTPIPKGDVFQLDFTQVSDHEAFMQWYYRDGGLGMEGRNMRTLKGYFTLNGEVMPKEGGSTSTKANLHLDKTHMPNQITILKEDYDKLQSTLRSFNKPGSEKELPGIFYTCDFPFNSPMIYVGPSASLARELLIGNEKKAVELLYRALMAELSKEGRISSDWISSIKCSDNIRTFSMKVDFVLEGRITRLVMSYKEGFRHRYQTHDELTELEYGPFRIELLVHDVEQLGHGQW